MLNDQKTDIRPGCLLIHLGFGVAKGCGAHPLWGHRLPSLCFFALAGLKKKACFPLDNLITTTYMM